MRGQTCTLREAQDFPLEASFLLLLPQYGGEAALVTAAQTGMLWSLAWGEMKKKPGNSMKSGEETSEKRRNHLKGKSELV